MIEINLTVEEFLKGLSCDKNNGLVDTDTYRMIIEYDDEHYLGLYYKGFNDKIYLDEKIIAEIIKKNKEYWDDINLKRYGMTTKRKMEDFIMKIMEIQEEYCVERGEDATQVISGLVVCNDYPVGVILPKRMLEYKSLYTIEDTEELSKDEVNQIFDGVKWWVDRLIERGIYTKRLYTGNVWVSPNNYGNVVLDRLDGYGVCEMVPDAEVEKAKENSIYENPYVDKAYIQLEDFREWFQKENAFNPHFI